VEVILQLAWCPPHDLLHGREQQADQHAMMAITTSNFNQVNPLRACMDLLAIGSYDQLRSSRRPADRVSGAGRSTDGGTFGC